MLFFYVLLTNGGFFLCLKICQLCIYVFSDFFSTINGYAGANARRRISLDKPELTVVHQKPGPLQTIFELLPDEASFLEPLLFWK